MLKKAVSYVLAFIFFIVLMAIVLCSIARMTVLDKNYLIGILDEYNYYEKTESRIHSAFENYIMQSGLEPEILDGLITQDKVKNDVVSFVNSIYSGQPYSIDADNIKITLKNRIDRILEDNLKTPNQEESEAIERFLTSISDAYKTEIIYNIGNLQGITVVLQNVTKYIDMFYIVFIILDIIFAVILYVINKKDNTFYVGIGTIASGIMLLVPQFIVSTRMHIEDIFIFNIDLSKIGVNILSDLLAKLNLCAYMCIGIGMLIVILRSTIKVKNKELL